MKTPLPLATFLLFVFALPTAAQTPETALNPAIEQIVSAVSEERMAATLRKLESFGTRGDFSSQDDPDHGIGAAKRWIFDQFRSDSPRLQVSYHNFTLKKSAVNRRIVRDVELSNVVAVLPGTVDPDRYVLITAHYDSVNIVHKAKFTDEERAADLVKHGMDPEEARRVVEYFPGDNPQGEPDDEATAAAQTAPGVTDDGSGVAAILELARVMSRYQFDKSIVFIAFAAEELGLEGARAYAGYAKQKGMDIEAVLNNDIIGSDVSGNGRTANGVLRVFGDSPEDSPARTLERYFKLIGERYVPSMRVEMVFHRDRFSRGGDHTQFAVQGFAAIRITSSRENYANQHSATDTFEHTSVPYAARVTRMNGAVLASLALAPTAPVTNYTIKTGEQKGTRRPMLSRGESGYDAVLRWLKSPEPDVAGYAVVMRSTTAPDWEREIWVGNVTSYTIPDLSIDDIVIGVKAVDQDGNQSLVSVYQEPFNPRQIAPAGATGK
ncbi:MAG TPA: M20/M25/M40 family metallo-hydrolase [Bryobacteraceae bacterium]|nr:M20/M25/M40 family metallo-hydrolase [Bryobacteraceae bacterium]